MEKARWNGYVLNLVAMSSLIGLLSVEALQKKYHRAVKEQPLAAKYFADVTAAAPKGLTPVWEKAISAAEKVRHMNPAAMDIMNSTVPKRQ